MTSAASTIGTARDALELAQQYARLAETQKTVLVPVSATEQEEHATNAVALMHLRRAQSLIQAAIREVTG